MRYIFSTPWGLTCSLCVLHDLLLKGTWHPRPQVQVHFFYPKKLGALGIRMDREGGD